MMLKSTAPKTIVEATTDKLWETGISLHNHQSLNPDKWYNKGWMSIMLMEICDDSDKFAFFKDVCLYQSTIIM